jgi:hypothetical protein
LRTRQVTQAQEATNPHNMENKIRRSSRLASSEDTDIGFGTPE